MASQSTKKYTIQLDINSKNAEAQIKTISTNYKKILTDFSGAASKMNVFKELVDYIAQVDTLLNKIKKEKPVDFKNFFGGLDQNLTKGLESIFNISTESVSVINELNEKIEKARNNGGKVGDLRNIAIEINSLFESMGKDKAINIEESFSKKGNVEERIKLLQSNINSLVDTFAVANTKLGSGLNFGNIISSNASDVVGEQVESLKSKKQELEKTINDINNTIERLTKLKKTGVGDNEDKITIEDFKVKQRTYNTAKDMFNNFKGDKNSDKYFKLALTKQQALADYYEAVNKINNNPDDYEDFDVKIIDKLDSNIRTLGSQLINGDAYKTIQRFLSEYEQQINNINSNIDKMKPNQTPAGTGGIVNTIMKAGDNSASSGEIVNNNNKVVASYDEVIAKVREYIDLSKKMEDDDLSDEDFQKYDKKMSNISQYLSKISNIKEDDIFSLFTKIEDSKISVEDMATKIVKAFGGEIPAAIGESSQALNKFNNSLNDTQPNADQGAPTTGTEGTAGVVPEGQQLIGNINFDSINSTIHTESIDVQEEIRTGKESIVESIVQVKDVINSIQQTINTIGENTSQISTNVQTLKANNEVDAQQQEVEAMKKVLLEFQKITNEHNRTKDVSGADSYTNQELGAIIFSDGKIGYSYGEGGSVPWDRYRSMIADNLQNKPTVNLHSHPFRNIWTNGKNNAGENTVLSQSDFFATEQSKKIGSSIDAMLNGNIMSVFNFTNVSQEKLKELSNAIKTVSLEFSKLSKYKDTLSFNKEGKLHLKYDDNYESLTKSQNAAKEVYLEALKRTGLSDNFKTYDLTKTDELTELARVLVDTNSQAKKDDKYDAKAGLTKILSTQLSSTELKSAEIKNIIHQFELGAITAKEAIQQATGDILNLTTKWVGDNISPTDNMLNNIYTTLLDISNNLQSILNNVQKHDTDQVRSQLNSLYDFEYNGSLKSNVFKNTKSLFDPTNNTEYYLNQLKKRYEDIFYDAESFATNLKYDGYDVTFDELQTSLDKISQALGAFKDYVNQDLFYKNGEIQPMNSFNDYKNNAQVDKNYIIELEDVILNVKRSFEAFAQTCGIDNVVDSTDLKSFAETIASALKNNNFGRDGSDFGEHTYGDRPYNISDISPDANALHVSLENLGNIIDEIRVKWNANSIRTDVSNITADFRELTECIRLAQSALIEMSNAINFDQLEQWLSKAYNITNTYKEIAEKINSNAGLSTDSIKDGTLISDNSQSTKTSVDLQELITALTNLTAVINSQSTELVTDGEKQIENKQYALETTLQQTNTILGRLANGIKIENPEDNNNRVELILSDIQGLISNLPSQLKDNTKETEISSSINNAIIELKNVANIFAKEKNKRDDVQLTPSTRISADYEQMRVLAGQSVSNIGEEIKIDKMTELQGGVVKVQGAVKNADGVWKGFITDIDSSNNAILRGIDAQSKFANSLNKSEKAVAEKSNQFVNAQEQKINSLIKYKDSIKDSAYFTDEFKNKMSELESQILSSSNTSDIGNYDNALRAFKEDYNTSVEKGIAIKIGELNSVKQELSAAMHTLDFKTTGENLNPEQLGVVNNYKELINLIEQYKVDVRNGHKVEIDAIESSKKALQDKINLYRQQNNIENASGSHNKKAYGDTVKLNATAKYNSIKQTSQDDLFKDSTVVINLISQYERAYQNLINMQKQFKVGENPSDEQKAAFIAAREECNKYAKALNKVYTDTHKLNELSDGNRFMLGGDFDGSIDAKRKALQEFVQESYGATAVIGDFGKGFNQLAFAINNSDGTLTQMRATINAAGTEIRAMADGTQEATTTLGKFLNEVKTKFMTIGSYLFASVSYHEVFNQIKKGVGYVKELDSALTELKKVTDETDETYNSFLKHMSQVGGDIGATAQNLTSSAADWARLGYSIEEAGELAKNTAILMNVSEFTDINQATDSMISALKAFDYSAQDSLHLVDIFNSIGNNFAVSTSDLASSLTKSASALVTAGVDLEQSAALLTGANTIMQDPDTVSQGLKVIALRIRGVKSELEDMGEETDGILNTSKLQGKIKALTGIDILDETNSFRNIYDILMEIAGVWDELDSMSQASVIELMAGKNRANVFTSIMKQADTIKSAYNTALDSEGSAMEENEKHLDSIQGRMELFTNALQTMWTDTLDSDTIKFFVDAGTAIIKFVDAIGLLPTLSGAFVFIRELKKGFGEAKISAQDFRKETLELLKARNNTTSQNNIADDLNEEVNAEIDKAKAKAEAAKSNAKEAKASQMNVNANIAEADAANTVRQAKEQESKAVNKAATTDSNEAEISKMNVNANIAEADAANTVKQAKDQEAKSSSKAATATSADAEASKVNTGANIAEAQSSQLVQNEKQEEAVASNIAETSDIGEATASNMVTAANTGEAVSANIVATANASEAVASQAAEAADIGEATASNMAAAANNGEATASNIAAAASGMTKLASGAKIFMGALAKTSVTMIAVSLLTKGIGLLTDAFKENFKSAEELAEEAEQLKTAYQQASSEIENSTSKIKAVEEEFNRLSKGVNDLGENISLSADDYKRYQEIVQELVGISPSLISGYNKEGKAIANKNGLIERSIELMEREQQLEAKKLATGDTGKNILKDIKNRYNAKEEKKEGEQLNYDLAFVESLSSKIEEYTTHQEHFRSDIIVPIIGKEEAEKIQADQVTESRNVVADYYEDFIEDLKSSNSIIEEYLGTEYANTLRERVAEYEDAMQIFDAELNKIKSEYNEQLSNTLLGSDEYWDLDSDMRNYAQSYVLNLDVNTENINEKEKEVEEFVKFLYKHQDDFSNTFEMGYEAISKTDKKGRALSYKKYIKNVEDFKKELQDSTLYNDEQKSWILSTLGIDTIEEDLKKRTDKIRNTLSNNVVGPLNKSIVGPLPATANEQIDIGNFISSLSTQDIEIFYTISAEPNSMTFEEIVDAIQKVKNATGVDAISIETHSTFVEQLEKHKEVLSQTQEIFMDNVAVTEEYKTALTELGISATELNECFYEANPLVVKNAEKLKELVKNTKNNTANNAKLAKSQAMLKYTKLQKQTQDLAKRYKTLTAAEKAQLNAMYDEMSALQKSIAKYSLLEHQLLGTANAYDEFAKAQEIDGNNTYTEQAQDMANTLAEAFNSAKLGTESAQAAIKGLVPESVYKDIDILDDKMQAIYDYFNGGTLSKYITIEYNDDDHSIERVEITMENMKKFFEDGKTNGVFTGTWDEFDLDPAINSLDQLAEKMNVTKEVAFAVMQEMEKYDINWLGGDFTTLLDRLSPDFNSLENEIYKTSTAMAELEQEFINGTISEEEYGEQVQKLSVQMSDLNEAAKEKALSYIELNKEITDVTTELQNARKELNKDPENEEALNTVKELSEKYKELAIRKAELGNLSELEMAQALEAASINADNLNDSLREVEGNIETTIEDLEKTYGIIANINSDGGIELSMSGSMSTELQEQLKGIGALKDDGTIDISLFYNTLNDEQKKQFDSLNELTGKKNLIEYAMSMDGEDTVQEALDGILQVLTNIFEQLQQNPSLTINTSSAKTNVDGVLTSLKDIVNGTWDKSVTITRTIKDRVSSIFGSGQANGNANVKGNAYANGKFGAPKTEEALVGELGPEMRVRGNRWELLGENGAEFTEVKKDDIIFNHKQTKQLLENGHINSRGRAYASGTAYAGINTWVSGYHDTSGSGNGDSSSSDDAKDEFKEVFDWFEVKLEEINELLDLWAAQLENIVDISGKGAKIDSIIDQNKYKLDILAQGLKLYEGYTNQLLSEIPAQYREAAKNGKIAIETFAGDAGEKTLEAINNYREWAQKVADVQLQMEELTQTIADLAKQKFDIIDEGYGNKITLMELQIDRLKDSVQLIEDKGNIAASQYYDAMTNITSDRISKLQEEHKLLQKSLDESVEAGDIAKYSDRWYEMVEAIYTVDQEIMECTSDLEEFQNAINEIHWNNFDELVNRLEYLQSETDSLIDLMEQTGEIIDYPKDNEYWGAKDVAWSKEGITSLGLYAQKMEIAEYTSEQYAKAIDNLNKDYKAGKYSVSEYQEKLDELKQAQYDSIKTYYDAQDAIVDLNKTRVDAIKDGINKEIEAYEKLINKKKEELSVEKDMYDFQKDIAEKQKDISAIERKISALSMDNSASAVAQRKKLEAELAEAKNTLDETYYDRSITDQQNALDKELESFKEQKDAEIEKWEEYLEDVQKVVADSLGIVQTNAIGVYDTLSEKASEYNLTLSDSITTPWKDGMNAVSSYQETFNTASSSTYEQLGNIKQQWQDIIDLMVKAANVDISNQKVDNQTHVAAEKKQQPTKQTTTTQQSQSTSAKSAQPSTSAGSTITVKSTATHFATGQRMASFVPGGSYTVYQDNGDRVLIGRNGAYTGWIYKKDIQGYASGTTGVKNNQLALIDELGEELVMHADGNGKLTFLSKGSSVIPHDISENLMKIGSIDPQEVLDRNRASISIAPSVANNNVNINISYGDILHIDKFDGNNPEDIAKLVEARFNEHTKSLNNSLKKYVR